MLSQLRQLASLVVACCLVYLLATAASGTPSHPVPSTSPSAEETEKPEHLTQKEKRERNPFIAIPKVMRLQERAWNRGDIPDFMTAYANSNGTTFASSGGITRGWSIVMARYVQRYGTNRKSMGTLRFEKLEITPLGKDYALVLGQWFLEPYVSKRDNTSISQKRGAMDGVFSLVWQRTPDGWKIIHDHSSARPAPTPAAQP